jgi:hypothetical protein
MCYRWGTPEWLQMRRKLIESDHKKASAARNQRRTLNRIRYWGLEYLM